MDIRSLKTGVLIGADALYKFLSADVYEGQQNPEKALSPGELCDIFACVRSAPAGRP